MPLEAGLSGSVDHLVTVADLADAVGSGSVAVLATPVVLTLCERATMAALDGELGPGQTSVGMRVQLDHLLPTPPGRAVRATAVLDRVDGRRLTFRTELHDGDALVADGAVTRVVVDAERFLDRIG